MPININNQIVKFRIHNKQSYTDGWLSFEPTEYNGTLHINSFDNSIWLAGEHLASGYGFPTYDAYLDTLSYIKDSYAYTLSYIEESNAYAYNTMLSYVDVTYTKAKTYTYQSYNTLYSYLTDSYAYTLSYIEESNAYAYNTMLSYVTDSYNKLDDEISLIKSTYVTYNGNIGYTYTYSLGDNINLNQILLSLLEPANYYKPQIIVESDENSYFECNQYNNFNIEVKMYNTEDESITDYPGYTSSCNSILFEQSINYPQNTNGSELIVNNNSYIYNFMFNPLDEGNYICSNNIILSYNAANYAFYPQLLKQNIQQVSYENWFDSGVIEQNYTFILKNRYKYYYGFNETTTSNINNLLNNIQEQSNEDYDYGWMNLINYDGEIEYPMESIKIELEENIQYSNFWIGLPQIIDKNIFVSDTKGFEILYHSEIGNQDLISDTVIKEEKEKVINGKNYNIFKYNFNEPIEGHKGDYLKFSISIS